jgi:hypothetical protein
LDYIFATLKLESRYIGDEMEEEIGGIGFLG